MLLYVKIIERKKNVIFCVKRKIKLNEKSGEKHAMIYVARSKKKDIRFFCT